MPQSRRDFIKLSLGTGLLSSCLSSFSTSASTTATATRSTAKTKQGNLNQQVVLYSAAMDKQGNYLAVAISESGELIFKISLPARAHAMLIRPDHHELLVFSRRPGYFLMVLDAQTGRLIKHIEIENNRPLCGHGVFSKDGETLYLTANNIDQQQGVIQVLDATNDYQQVNEFSSGGIGPHEIRLLSDGTTLVVANGGILTHPESGRVKLNLDRMTPALTYLEVQKGRVLGDYRLPPKYHQLSIRHLDINQNDTVCFAMQYQGSRHHQFPLVGFHRPRQSTLQLARMPTALLSAMKNYCGSVCVDPMGKNFAVSSPRGNLMTLWSEEGHFVMSQVLNDGCGIAMGHSEKSFYLSSGTGEIKQYDMKDKQGRLVTRSDHYHWDNHLLSYDQS